VTTNLSTVRQRSYTPTMDQHLPMQLINLATISGMTHLPDGSKQYRTYDYGLLPGKADVRAEHKFPADNLQDLKNTLKSSTDYTKWIKDKIDLQGKIISFMQEKNDLQRQNQRQEEDSIRT